MNSSIMDMLSSYKCRFAEDYRVALKEIIQEIALLGLFRGGFFSHAALYGGTALRIFYGLDRFSEDLDFSLLKTKNEFDLSIYLKKVQDELGSFGFDMTVEEKIKKNDTPKKSAFIKGGTQIHIMKIEASKPPVTGINPNEQLRIKLEVDTQPPSGAYYEMKYQLQPVPYSVQLFDPSSLFAGKIHALLCRSWETRVKGRDFYDYIWFLSKSIPVNINHLESRMYQTGHIESGEKLSEENLKTLLHERFESIDFKQARNDVLPFIKNSQNLDLWSAGFFFSITKDRLKIKSINKEADEEIGRINHR